MLCFSIFNQKKPFTVNNSDVGKRLGASFNFLKIAKNKAELKQLADILVEETELIVLRINESKQSIFGQEEEQQAMTKENLAN